MALFTSHPLLPLNDSRVIFIHPERIGLDGSPAVAVQVTLKAEQTGVDEAYTRVQQEITRLVCQLIMKHLDNGLPPRFIVEDDRYSIIASRKDWSFGRSMFRVTWGDEEVTPSDEKWTFIFEEKDSEST